MQGEYIAYFFTGRMLLRSLLYLDQQHTNLVATGIQLEELINLLTYNSDELIQDVGYCCDLGETMS